MFSSLAKGKLFTLRCCFYSILIFLYPALAENNKVAYQNLCRMLDKADAHVLEMFLASQKLDLNQPCERQEGWFGGMEAEYPLEEVIAPRSHYGKRDKRLKAAEVLIKNGAKLDYQKADGTTVFLSVWSELPKNEHAKEVLDFALTNGVSLKTQILQAKPETIRFKRANDPTDDHTGADALMLLASGNGFDGYATGCVPGNWMSKSPDCKESLAMFSLLVKHSDLEARDAYGRTALHRAIDFKNSGTARLLLEAGANVSAVDNVGLSVSDYAVSSGEEKLLAVLQTTKMITNEDSPEASLENTKESETEPAAVAKPVAIEVAAVQQNTEVTLGSAIKTQKSGNFQTARSEFSQLAKTGNVEASFELGRMHAKGEGGPKDFTKAKQYFEYAAKANHPKALFALGLMYVKGDGVPKDKARAKEYLKKAASLGSTDAKSLLGNL